MHLADPLVTNRRMKQLILDVGVAMREQIVVETAERANFADCRFNLLDTLSFGRQRCMSRRKIEEVRATDTRSQLSRDQTQTMKREEYD